jgi:ion channel POLLUX/CASTOR
VSKHSWWQVFRYKFDNYMARGGWSIFTALVVVFVVCVLIIGGLRAAVNYVEPEGAEREGNFLRQIYQSFNHLSDPGTMAYDIDSSFSFKLTAILGGMIGIVIFSTLIAFITTAMDQKIHDLRKGHSKVIEEEHTLILGWNERVMEILRELILANESEDDPCVVILSRREKEDMDDSLALYRPDTGNTRVVTRSGSESSLVNLDVVSVDAARSIIVLAHCNPSANDQEKASSDHIAIKTILAVVASLPDGAAVPIIAEIFHDRNREVVRDISPNVITVDADEILAKIMVQTSRSIGLSVVYGEILSFDGCEMYFHEAEWGDVAFGDLPYRFPDGIPMGLRRGDDLLINPAIDTRLEAGDAILILAEDDSTIDYRPEPIASGRDLPLAGGRTKQGVERELIIGWTPKVETIIREYADYVQDGSAIDVMLRAADAEVRNEIERIDKDLPGVNVSLVDGDPLVTEQLLLAEPFDYDNIIILSQGNGGDDERTDSETIVILLLLRKIFAAFPEESAKTKLITEVLDSENQALVSRTGVHEFIISNRYISMLLAQISEDGDIERVYDDLFQEDGSEIYLKSAALYFTEFPAEVTYGDMIRIAQKRGEVCLGVKIKAREHDADQNYGVKLIPPKDATYTLQPQDTLVVLAEDES